MKKILFLINLFAALNAQPLDDFRVYLAHLPHEWNIAQKKQLLNLYHAIPLASERKLAEHTLAELYDGRVIKDVYDMIIMELEEQVKQLSICHEQECLKNDHLTRQIEELQKIIKRMLFLSNC